MGTKVHRKDMLLKILLNMNALLLPIACDPVIVSLSINEEEDRVDTSRV